VAIIVYEIDFKLRMPLQRIHLWQYWTYLSKYLLRTGWPCTIVTP